MSHFSEDLPPSYAEAMGFSANQMPGISPGAFKSTNQHPGIYPPNQIPGISPEGFLPTNHGPGIHSPNQMPALPAYQEEASPLPEKENLANERRDIKQNVTNERRDHIPSSPNENRPNISSSADIESLPFSDGIYYMDFIPKIDIAQSTRFKTMSPPAETFE